MVDASDGIEALRGHERESVDGVILDILMPDGDGFRLCLEIRKSEKFLSMPFILYTSTYNSPEDRELAQSGRSRSIHHQAGSHAGDPRSAARSRAENARTPRRIRPPDGTRRTVLGQYNEALVRKLEEKNAELQKALDALRAAHGDIVELNRCLESRVQQRTAELESANKELDAFSYSVSHDLRAPLRAIGAISRILLRQHAADLSTRKHANIWGWSARTPCRWAAWSTTSWHWRGSAASRWWRGRSRPSRVVVEQVLHEVRQQHEGRAVTVALGDLPEVEGDPGAAQAGLRQPVDNAIKYTASADAGGYRLGRRRRTGSSFATTGSASICNMPTSCSSVSAAPSRGGFRRHRRRPCNRAAHRPAPRRPHLGGGRKGKGGDILFHARRVQGVRLLVRTRQLVGSSGST